MAPGLTGDTRATRDYYAEQDLPKRTTINQTPYLTPYLGLQARLSQIWINRWTILLLLVLVRTLIACASLDDNLGSARREALSACSSVESMGSAMASMPHYMSQGANELAATGVEKAVNGLMSMVGLSITAVEEIVLFIINLMTSTYVCLITLAVGGSLHAAVDVLKKAGDFLDDSLPTIADGIKSTVDDFQDSLNKFVDGLNSIPEAFGGHGDIPTLDISGDLDKLNNFNIPPAMDLTLMAINNSIPTFPQVHKATNDAIKFPFEKVKDLVNEAMGTYKFDRSLFPIPAKEKLTFCSDDNGINDFFDDLVNIERTARRIFIIVIVIAAVLVCVPMAYYEIHRYRRMKSRAALVNQNAFDPMDVVYIASRPQTSNVGIKVANRFESPRRRTLVRWAIAYATSTPALFVLSLGLAGLFSCLCQYILLRSIEKEVPQLTNQVSGFAEKVVTSLNNASQQWAVGTNKAIDTEGGDINKQLFGWVNTSTTAVNDTLNTFVDEMMGGLKDVFGGTPLFEPIKEVLNCLVLIKVRGIENGLTWVHDHAHIDFPHLPEDMFSLGAVASIDSDKTTDSFLSNPGTVAKDEITGVVNKLVHMIQSGIRQEAIISACIIIVWIIIAIIGLSRTAILLCLPSKGRGEGGQFYSDDPVTNNYRAQAVDVDARPMSLAPPYTLNPQPFPGHATTNAEDEKMGSVAGAQNVGNATTTRSPYVRASSHGAVGGVSPIDEKSASRF